MDSLHTTTLTPSPATRPPASTWLAPLLDPRSIAIIGANPSGKRVGGMALQLLTSFGYRGAIYPVNPKYDEMFGLRCWPDIEATPSVPDVAVLATSAKDVTPMLRRCHARGVPAAVVYASGFSEAGEDGQRLQQELEAFARESGMAIAGPNCMGFSNLTRDAYTAFSGILRDTPRRARSGSTSVLAQSGNLSSAIYVLGNRRQVGFNHLINTGNEAVVDFSAYLSFLAQDQDTSVVLSYMEQLRDGEAFVRAAAEMHAQGKLLALLKAGTSEQGKQAVQSHTAALAGDEAVYRAMFRQLNVVRVRDFANLADIATLARERGRTAGKRVLVLSISGAMGAVIADRLIELGCEVPPLPAALRETLAGYLPGFAMSFNPIDLTGNIVADQSNVLALLDACARTDAVDTVVLYAMGYMLDSMAPQLLEVARSHPRLLCVFDSGDAEQADALRAGGVPVFPDIGQGLDALAGYLHWVDRREATRHWLSLRSAVRRQAQAAPPGQDEHAVKRWLSNFGLSAVQEQFARNADEAALAATELGYPVVLKILSADVPHKTEVGGVQLGLADAHAVRVSGEAMIARVQSRLPQARIEGLLVQRMESVGVELILGAVRDPVVGWTLTVGLGGTLTELYRDTSHRLLPVDRAMAETMVRELKAFPLLDGFRGSPKMDLPALHEAIECFSAAVLCLPDSVSSLEINPLRVRPQGQGVAMLDALAL
ncbi:MAG: CoA-binding protein [Comamonadaceae bacterium]|nr:MAG: CoA-binding protein [Comamonadaceae bacterium]